MICGISSFFLRIRWFDRLCVCLWYPGGFRYILCSVSHLVWLQFRVIPYEFVRTSHTLRRWPSMQALWNTSISAGGVLVGEWTEESDVRDGPRWYSGHIIMVVRTLSLSHNTDRLDLTFCKWCIFCLRIHPLPVVTKTAEACVRHETYVPVHGQNSCLLCRLIRWGWGPIPNVLKFMYPARMYRSSRLYTHALQLASPSSLHATLFGEASGLSRRYPSQAWYTVVCSRLVL